MKKGVCLFAAAPQTHDERSTPRFAPAPHPGRTPVPVRVIDPLGAPVEFLLDRDLAERREDVRWSRVAPTWDVYRVLRTKMHQRKGIV